MEGNPYSQLIIEIRKDLLKMVPAMYRIGEVECVIPLAVRIAGIVHNSSSLLKNEVLTSFTVGDQLLLQPIEDEQRYIIICKVVGA